MRRFWLLLLIPLFVVACSDDERDEPYPSLITEMALLSSDASGNINSFTTDAGTTYTLTSSLTGAHANARWRFLVGYVLKESQRATIYSLDPVIVLRDSTARPTAYRDPVGFVSAWLGGGFVNLHLTPKTKGGVQSWGFLRDSTSLNAVGGTTHHISLYHRQGSDPTAYSADTYLSLALDSVQHEASTADSIKFTLITFSGKRAYQFGLSH